MNAEYRSKLETARACRDAGDARRAIVFATEAVTLSPEAPLAHALLATLFSAEGLYGEARFSAERAVELAPAIAGFHHIVAEVAVSRGDWAAVSRSALAALAIDPYDQRALCHLAATAERSNDKPTVERLLDYEALIVFGDVATPEGFQSVADFNAALLSALEQCAESVQPLVGGTLIGGSRLSDTFRLGPEICRPLEKMIQAARTRFTGGLRIDADHPVVAGAPATTVVTSWINIMPAGSYERPHIHESGWLSGVYYAEMPLGDDARDAGALIFGGLPQSEVDTDDFTRRVVHPRAGSIVIFPSYLTHRTVPTQGGGRRISVAFDIQGV